ncbi:MAG: cyclic pyranopterin monophosphate synthase MoaC [Candidatus Cloacimonadota bacterium]|nr:MAG: cyclic pyranopterin monophosphate synthase MoaC [Candidatus Cloacimonadota bacterium]
MNKLTHFDKSGRASMVDITSKENTERFAIAKGKVYMKPETISFIEEDKVKKGDVIAVAKIAGIMAAKRVDELIPMCHKLLLTNIKIDLNINRKESFLEITSTVKSTGKTGVEMEALAGVSVAALTVYDMCKAADRGMIISDIKLIEKRGGKSGHFVRKKEKAEE